MARARRSVVPTANDDLLDVEAPQVADPRATDSSTLAADRRGSRGSAFVDALMACLLPVNNAASPSPSQGLLVTLDINGA